MPWHYNSEPENHTREWRKIKSIWFICIIFHNYLEFQHVSYVIPHYCSLNLFINYQILNVCLLHALQILILISLSSRHYYYSHFINGNHLVCCCSLWFLIVLKYYFLWFTTWEKSSNVALYRYTQLSTNCLFYSHFPSTFTLSLHDHPFPVM